MFYFITIYPNRTRRAELRHNTFDVSHKKKGGGESAERKKEDENCIEKGNLCSSSNRSPSRGRLDVDLG